jgi:hypothetical protein
MKFVPVYSHLEVSSRLRIGLRILGSAIREAMLNVQGFVETTAVNPTKPYKPRKLKLDPIHRMARLLYKMRAKNPQFKRDRKLYQKTYKRKNKMLLERRKEFVKKARDRMGLD